MADKIDYDHEIEVTTDDIKMGREGSAYSCPVSIAIKRQTPYRRISIGLNTYYIESAGGGLPREISAFIVDFDRGAAVRPFKFKLFMRAESPNKFTHTSIKLIK